MRTLSILLIATTTAFAADKMVKEEVSLTPTNQLTFEHPERFRYDVVQQPDDGFRTALRFRCFGADDISTLSFKLFAGKDADGTLKTQTEVDAAVKKMGASYVDGSVEKTNAVQRMKHKTGAGAYSVFTDADLAGVAQLRPGEFRHITLGLVKVGDFVFTVRGYSNGKDGDDYKAMVTVFEGLSIEKKAADDKPKKNP